MRRGKLLKNLEVDMCHSNRIPQEHEEKIREAAATNRVRKGGVLAKNKLENPDIKLPGMKVRQGDPNFYANELMEYYDP